MVIDSTIETVTTDVHDDDSEEVITKLIEDNEKQEERLANSLEEVIVDLNEFVYDATITESTDNFTETITSTEEFESTTARMHIDDLSDPDSTEVPIVKNFITQQALSQLNDANLTERDASILTALLELEILKGEQKDTTKEINTKLQQLELLLNSNSNSIINNISITSNHVQGQEIITLKDANKIKQKPRRPKTIPDNILEQKTSTVNLFQNIQSQLFNLLDERHKFLKIISQKINAELHVIQQTVQILQQLINLKLNHGEKLKLIHLLLIRICGC